MARVYDNATDIITFARGSSATYTGSDGTQQTAASDEPRIEYAADGSLKGLLIEEQRTNLLLNSDNPDTQVATLPAGSHTLSFVGGPSVTGISDSIDDNAVDVFVYDTSKDTDGGAWRTGSLARASSWYAEASSPTRDPNTRSTRAEFPAVAVIVAESNKLTIYDGDDPSLPMWMVFDGGSVLDMLTEDGSNPSSSVSMLNGKMCIGSLSTYGLVVIDFLADNALRYRANTSSSYSGYYNGAISTRNDGLSWDGTDPFGTIVNRNINDVAMTVLPDAPTDPATGLPVPTIAVATDGGVSVIKDDGTVVDITYTAKNIINSIDFDADNNITFVNGISGTSYQYAARKYAIPTADIVEGDGATSSANDLRLFFPTVGITGGDTLRYKGNATALSHVVGNIAIGNTSSTDGGLSQLAEDPTTPANGMVAYTTTSYNTGWMNGDIKLAALADTDDTDLVGSGELVANSTFDTDITGWTDASPGSASISWNASGYIQLNGVSADRGTARTAISTTVGKTYKITATDEGSNLSWQINLGTFVGGNNILSGSSNTTDRDITFVAQSTTTHISLVSLNSTGQSLIDNVSVKLADADRSVNNNGLIVNGTVTRTSVATGADVVAYSGFNSNNYLEQPYNPDLDFGEGDFCVMGWANVNNVGGSKYIAARASHNGTNFSGAGFVFRFDGNEFPTFSISDDGFATFDLVAYSTALTGRWTHVVGVRRGSVLELYVDGALVNTTAITAATGSLNNASAVLSVGNLSGLLTVPMDGSLALLRISGTAPTADQIAKIYEDEKVLFQPNAKATLTGNSDAVTALAHDPDTNLLHVGTSGGRSVFYGLRRVNETATAVTTAISAVDGLIVEQ